VTLGVQIIGERDIVVTSPDFGFSITYRKDGLAPMLVAIENIGHQARSLRKLRELSSNWEPANLPRISRQTWATLMTLGFVEERRDGASSQRSLDGKGTASR
jgi:hypothetical protein